MTFEAYSKVRKHTEALCAPLKVEDYVVQSMPDVSPPKWHLAHTSWFFENFVLQKTPGYKVFHEAFGFLFNSYYNGIGKFHPRDKRGMITRPTVKEVYEFRRHVDEAMKALPAETWKENAETIALGLQHEQQHQELLLTDIKHILAGNPLQPVYRETPEVSPVEKSEWIAFEGGLVEVGDATNSFSFDNEKPRHKVWLEKFHLSSRLVTNGEYLEFIDDGGYRNPLLWLSNGWHVIKSQNWQAPLYWEFVDEKWTRFTLNGRTSLNPNEPVLHLSYYEADAFARWRGKRLPTEFEWEIASGDARLSQLYDVAWQWTASAYLPYPGFRPYEGNIVEYNGKFMCDQWVLRGSSLATPEGHTRRTYRNFFPADARWQFSGMRLAF